MALETLTGKQYAQVDKLGETAFFESRRGADDFDTLQEAKDRGADRVIDPAMAPRLGELVMFPIAVSSGLLESHLPRVA